MYLCSWTRENLLALLPKGGVAVEIGTAKGQFAAAILKNADPAHLHLIDPWVHHTQGDYTHDRSNVAADEQEARYRGVLDAFAAGIAEGRVFVHRTTSDEAASCFADSELDWVYVDGLHTFDGVLADLRGYAAKLKPDGFLLGHDYTNLPLARQQGFGVIEAVNRFVAESAFDLAAITLEPFPTYVLTRPGPATDAVIGRMFQVGAVVAKIEGYPAGGTFDHIAYEVGDRRGALPVFTVAPPARPT